MNKISPDLAAAILAGFNLAAEMVEESPMTVPTSVAAFFQIHGADVRKILEEMSAEPVVVPKAGQAVFTLYQRGRDELARRGADLHESMLNPQNHFYGRMAMDRPAVRAHVRSGNGPVDVKGIMDNAIRNASNGWSVDHEALTAVRDAMVALIDSDKNCDLARYYTYTRRGLETPQEGEKRIRDAEDRRYRNLARVWGD